MHQIAHNNAKYDVTKTTYCDIVLIDLEHEALKLCFDVGSTSYSYDIVIDFVIVGS